MQAVIEAVQALYRTAQMQAETLGVLQDAVGKPVRGSEGNPLATCAGYAQLVADKLAYHLAYAQRVASKSDAEPDVQQRMQGQNLVEAAEHFKMLQGTTVQTALKRTLQFYEAEVRIIRENNGL